MGAAVPIFAAVAGSMASSAMSDKGSSSQVQTAEPWSGVQPHLRTLYDAAMSNFNQGGPQYYPNSTVAPQGAVTGQAQQGLYSRATQGNPLLSSGQNATDATLNDDYMWNNPSMLMQLGIGSGSMLNSNPYLDDMFDQAAGRVGEQFSKYTMPGVTSMFAGAGRYGSNQHEEGMRSATSSFGDTLNNLATSIYGGNYANERNLQQQALTDAGTQFGRERVMQGQAAGLTPGLSQADYFDIAQLMGLGGQQDARSQQLLDSDIARWDFNQQQPNESISFLNNVLSGATPYRSQTTTGSVSQQGNPLTGAMGGYLLGNSMFGSQPSMYAPGGAASSGFGSGTAFGNQDLGLFL